jgi:transposase-like protein
VFDGSIIELCMRRYIAKVLSYRNLVGMMGECGVTVEDSTIPPWVTSYGHEYEKYVTLVRHGGKNCLTTATRDQRYRPAQSCGTESG